MGFPPSFVRSLHTTVCPGDGSPTTWKGGEKTCFNVEATTFFQKPTTLTLPGSPGDQTVTLPSQTVLGYKGTPITVSVGPTTISGHAAPGSEPTLYSLGHLTSAPFSHSNSTASPVQYQTLIGPPEGGAAKLNPLSMSKGVLVLLSMVHLFY
jgi:hypothetical protein